MLTSKKTQFDLVTVGGATIDTLFYSHDGELIKSASAVKQRLLAFEYGAKIIADKIYLTPGGAAANVSVAASRLGLKSAAICRIGNDEKGRSILANFKANNVATGFVRIDKKEATAFSTVLTIDNAAKEHIAFIYRGANSNLTAADIPTAINAKWLYVSSLPKLSWVPIMEKLVKSGKKITWNPGNEQLADISKLTKFLPRIEVLMVNHAEALEFKKLKDMKGLLAYIHSLGPKLVVITDSASGAYAFDGKTYYYLKAKPAKVINTLGVGDAFGSGLTSALICDKKIKEALTWGASNAASVVTEIGAQKGLLTRAKIAK